MAKKLKKKAKRKRGAKLKTRRVFHPSYKNRDVPYKYRKTRTGRARRLRRKTKKAKLSLGAYRGILEGYQAARSHATEAGDAKTAKTMNEAVKTLRKNHPEHQNTSGGTGRW